MVKGHKVKLKINFYLLLLVLFASCGQRQGLREEVIPPDLPKIHILINKEGFDDYLFLRSTSAGAQFMINSNGKVVWYQQSDTLLPIEFAPYAHSYLSLYAGQSPREQLHEITYEGDTLLKLSFGTNGYDRHLHHEIIKDDNNDILGLTHEVINIDLSRVGGKQNDTLKTNGIIKLSRTGKKLWSWAPNQVMDPIAFPEINKHKTDWGHANALMIDQDGNYLISWRDFNQIWKISSISGEILWKYGAQFIKRPEDRFYQQHSINRNLDGDYMVFDNGMDSIRRSSRAVMFNNFGGTIRNTHSIGLADSLFTTKKGSVYQFDKDRFLFCSTMSNLLVITDREGNVLWMAKSTEGFYRAYYLDKDVLE